MNQSRYLLRSLRAVRQAAQRDFGVSATPALQKVSDPIQQLFIDKLREYKKKSSGGQMVDPTPEIQKEHAQELMKLAKQFGGKEGEDMTKFPDFKFVDPVIDPINEQE